MDERKADHFSNRSSCPSRKGICMAFEKGSIGETASTLDGYFFSVSSFFARKRGGGILFALEERAFFLQVDSHAQTLHSPSGVYCCSETRPISSLCASPLFFSS